MFKRALSIIKNAVGVAHPRYSRGAKNYAVLLRKLGRGEEADSVLDSIKSKKDLIQNGTDKKAQSSSEDKDSEDKGS